MNSENNAKDVPVPNPAFHLIQTHDFFGIDAYIDQIYSIERTARAKTALTDKSKDAN